MTVAGRARIAARVAREAAAKLHHLLWPPSKDIDRLSVAGADSRALAPHSLRSRDLARCSRRSLIVTPEASAYCDACSDLPTRDKTTPPSSIATTDPARETERAPARFHGVLGWAWVAFLLLVIGYATVESERVLAELDSLKVLAAYSTGVRRMVRPDRVVPAADAQPRQSPSATRVP